MIKPPSLQSTYTLVWSNDPALELPVHADDPALSADDNAAASAETDKERARLLRVARATGNWSAITKPGEQPTVFHFQNLSRSEWSWAEGEINRRRLGALESNDLMFLIALRRIDNFDCKVERYRASEIEGTRDHIWMTKPSVVDKLHAALANVEDGATMLIAEFVAEIVRRARGQLDPLS